MSLQWSATANAGLALQYYPDTGSSPNIKYWPQTEMSGCRAPMSAMTHAIMGDSIFQTYPPMTRERAVQLEQAMRNWVKQYDKQAIPGLLWVWAQDHDPSVLRRNQGIRPRLAQALLKELGDNAMAYWNWYLDRVLEAHK